ncbi:3'-5' RNA exonuclease complex component [Coemansia sp. IMI 209127]|nr:3'-5' RNA exonuclease complex component [Coemansia sp. IMI 209127]
MQSRVCARAAHHPSAARLRLAALGQRSIFLKTSLSRLHTSAVQRSDKKEYPELDDILGKPAASFSELVDQLETLIKHPNPPRNYADALAKEELRRSDVRDLALESDKDKSTTQVETTPIKILLKQRPRLSRQPQPDDGFDIAEQPDGADGTGSGMTNLDAQDQETGDSSASAGAEERRSFTYEVPPLTQGQAANLGITKEQQERRRIWMTKISGYRKFRSSMLSMDKVLDILDRDDPDIKKADGSASGIKENGKFSELDNDEEMSKLLDKFDGKSSAERAEDREFEELIRRSWRLHDEDLVFGTKGAASDDPTKPSSASFVKPAPKHSDESIRRHVFETKAAEDNDVLPIGSSVSTGDLVEMRLPKEGHNSYSSGSELITGFVIQKTTGRFHFNVMTSSQMVLGMRAQRLGFVARGVLFNERYLRSTGIKDDDITRLLKYGRELRDFEDTHGREAVVSATEAAQFLPTTNRKRATEEAEGDINDLNDMSAETVSDDLDVGVLGQAYDQQQEDVDGNSDSEEPFSEFVFRVVPAVARNFREQADALLLSHYRELRSYYDVATRNGQNKVTVDGLARLIFRNKAPFLRTKDGGGEPVSEIARFAAFMHLISDPVRFIPDIHVFYTSGFELRSPEDVKDILDAKNIVRNRSSEFKDFLETAQKLVSYSYARKPDVPLRRSLDPDADSVKRNTRCDLTGWKYELLFPEQNAPHSSVPTKNEINEIKFNDTARLLIRIMTKYVFNKNEGYTSMINPYYFVISPIMKNIGVYGAIDVASVVRFLVDIGVWPYWFNPGANIRRYPFGDFANGTPVKRLREMAEAYADQYLDDMVSPADKQRDIKEKPDLAKVSDLVPPVVDNILTKASDGKGTLKASDFYDHDICKAIRHDFGSLPVYTIDSKETRDVDDGVSLETVKGANGEDKTWIHIHIADPTALIHPGHILAESAKLSSQSVYIPEMTINMLPNKLLESSLALCPRSDGKPTYTLTFSVLIGEDGDIAEYKVRPGVVNNTTPVPYDMVDQFAKFDPKLCIYSSNEDVLSQRRLSTLVHPFEADDYNAFESTGAARKLPERVVSDLRQAQEIAMRHTAYRVRQGTFTRILPELNFSVDSVADLSQPGPDIGEKPAFLDSRFMSHNYDGKIFPKITSVSFPESYTPAHAFVGELMVIAGRVAARFSYEHNSGFGGSMLRNGSGVVTGPSTIPLLYRSQQAPDLDTLSGIAPGLPVPFEGMSSKDAESSHVLWNAVLQIARERGGIVDRQYFDEIRHMMNPSVLQGLPGPHTIMGIFDKYGYTRITSPLRRVDDLIGHWQIKAQLLAEHTDSKDKMPWYWKHGDIERLAPIIYYATVATNKFSSICDETWGHTLMQRMEYQARRGKLEPPLPGFYDTSSPYYQDTPWAYYSPQKPGPLIWTATVDNRSELRPFISLVINGFAIRAMLIPRPVDVNMLPFAGTKVRVQVIGIEPHKLMVIVKLAPEELQPAETPKFWRSQYALSYLPKELSSLYISP